MVSRNQAEKAAESIMKPSRDKLASRKDKLSEAIRNRASPIYPSLAAALGTYFALSNGATTAAALTIGIISGVGIGTVMQRKL